MIVHELKTWPKHFLHVYAGTKRFELRRDDRGFQVGDLLHLREWEPSLMYGATHQGEYTGKSCMAKVLYILREEEEQPEFIADGYVIMSIEVIAKG